MQTLIVDSADAAVDGIDDGSTILVGGSGLAGEPTVLIDALIDHGAHELTVVSNNAGGVDTGLAVLLAAGRVRKVVCSFPRQPDSLALDDMYRNKKVDLELVPQDVLAERIRAGAVDIGTEFTETREQHSIEHPIRGDYALIRAHIADRFGNLAYRRTTGDLSPAMARAAMITIAEVRNVVEAGQLDPEAIGSPSVFVNRILNLARAT